MDHSKHRLSCGLTPPRLPEPSTDGVSVPSLDPLASEAAPSVVDRPRPAARPRIVAYIGQWSVGDGSGVLLRQKAAIDVCAEALGSRPLAYYVDAGRRDGPASYGHALLRLLDDARAGKIDVIVVARMRDLAEERGMALKAAVALRADVKVRAAYDRRTSAGRGGAPWSAATPA